MAILVSVAALPTAPTDTITLRLNLKQGDSFRFKVIVDQHIGQTVMGQAQTMVQKIGLGQQFDVLSATDSLYQVRVRYYWAMYEQDSPAGRIAYNSDDPPEIVHPMAIGFDAVLGRHVMMTMDPLGRVSDIDGVDAMLASIMIRFDSLGIALPGVEESLRQQFGDEAMKIQMENIMAIYPEEEVSIDDTWIKEVAWKAGMPRHLTNTYRLAAVEEDTVRIELASTVVPGDGQPVALGGVSLVYSVSGTQQGMMWLDKATGFPLRVDIAQQVAGQVTMNGSTTWPIEIQVKNSMETE